MSRQGIDYAWHGAIDYAGVKSDGYDFVCRYLSHDDGKNIHADEASAWHNHGVDVVLVWETTATRAEGGHAAGVDDANAAKAQALAVGAPANLPLFFAVDEDTTVGPNITGYFQGVNSVLGVHRTGAYGGVRIISGLFDKGLIGYGWQTYAWSGGQWDNRAQLRQVHNGSRVRGLDCDLNVAHAADFGQWSVSAPPAPEPHPQPHPQPQPTPVPVNRFDLKALQKVLGVTADGVWGSNTQAAAASHEVKSGSTGPVVAWVQGALNRHGQKLAQDGQFGPATDSGVRHFQSGAGLGVDGVAGPDTLRKLAA